MNFPYSTTVDLPNWGECEVNYDVIEGDPAWGLEESYEWEVIYGGDFEDVGFIEGTEITTMMSESENQLIIKAIEKDLRDTGNDI
jgi:hypothetical protein